MFNEHALGWRQRQKHCFIISKISKKYHQTKPNIKPCVTLWQGKLCPWQVSPIVKRQNAWGVDDNGMGQRNNSPFPNGIPSLGTLCAFIQDALLPPGHILSVSTWVEFLFVSIFLSKFSGRHIRWLFTPPFQPLFTQSLDFLLVLEILPLY